MNMISEAVERPFSSKNCSIYAGQSPVESYETLRAYCGGLSSLELRPLVQGGALVRQHFTKEQQLTRLKKRTEDYINGTGKNKDTDDDIPEPVKESLLPQEVKDFLTIHRQKIGEITFAQTQGRCIVEMGLKITDVNTLKTIEEMMKRPFKGKKDTSGSCIWKMVRYGKHRREHQGTDLSPEGDGDGLRPALCGEIQQDPRF